MANLALYGHPFSSYTWKAQIALHALDLDYVLREVGPDSPAHLAFVAEHGGPWGKFPVLVDGDAVLSESTTIIEHLALKHPGTLIPDDPVAALAVRNMDRVFDNYVMAAMQVVVDEHIRAPEAPAADRIATARERLRQSYRWLERRLALASPGSAITLVECAAAPALFYADWVEPIGDANPHLRDWRAALLARPEVARCVEAARPYRAYFPPGAPDRD